MRKFNFYNLALTTNGVSSFYSNGLAGSSVFGQTVLTLPLFTAAPQPLPLFAEINGTSANDTLTGTAGDDVINGLAGNDILIGGEGGDALNGGDGNDTASYEDAAIAATVNLRIGTVLGAATGDSYSSIENLTGSDFDDTLTGDFGANVLTGGLGNDVLNGSRGNDVLHGDDGDDTLNGGNNDDTLYGGLGNDELFGDDGANSLYGGAGDDMLYTEGDDAVLDGGSGFDILWSIFPETINDFTTYDINLRPVQMDGIEALNYYWSGSASSVYANLEVNSSQYSQIQEYHNWFVRTEIYFNSGDVLDLTNLTYVGNIVESEFFLFGGWRDETVIASDSFVSFQGGENDDTLILSPTHIDELDFAFIELSNDEGEDVLDASLIPTIQNDPNGDNGLLTFDLVAGEVRVTSTPGFDEIFTAENYETAIGWDGDDIFIGDGADNTFMGNDGDDIAVYSSSNSSDYFIIETAPGEYSVNAVGMTNEGTDILTGIETIRLGGVNGTDYAIGDLAVESNCTRVLTNGDDTASLSRGEVLCALDGNDTISVSADRFSINNTGTAFGGDGLDTLDVDGEDFGVFVDGISFENNHVGGTFNFMTGEVSENYLGISFGGFEALEFRGGGLTDTVTGGDGNDIIDGGAFWEDWVWDEYFQQHDVNIYVQPDFLYGMGGDDILTTFAGDDTLDGGTGDDLLNGGWNYGLTYQDNDTIIGGDGIDTAIYSSSDAKDYIFTETAPGEYTVEAVGGSGEGTDTLTGIEFIRLGGIDGNDYDIAALANGTNLTGGDDIYIVSSDEIVNALDGDDILIVNGDNVSLNGGAGTDTADYSLAHGRVIIDIFTNTTDFEAIGDSFSSIENLTGGDFSDALRGDSGVNVLSGGGAQDYLNGRGGNDILIGGGGNDSLTGGFGEDVLFGGIDNDYLDGSGGDDELWGEEGNDRINGGDGIDVAIYTSADLADYQFTLSYLGVPTITGIGAGAVDGSDTLEYVEYIRFGGENGTDYAFYDLFQTDVVYLTYFDDVYSGSSTNVVVHAGNGNDIIDGGTGNNWLRAGYGNDIIISLGNDIIEGSNGNDIVEMGGNIFDPDTETDGGSGRDTLSFSTLAQLPSGNIFLVVDLGSQSYSIRDGNSILYVDPFIQFENVTGSEFGDLLQGGAHFGDNVLSGLGGDDHLQGRRGEDTLDGGAGADILNGGDQIDVATYASAVVGVTAIMGDASLNTGDAAGDSYIDIENITGSDFDDILGGDAAANIVNGGAGFDIVSYAYASTAIVFDGLGLVAASGDITADTFLNIEAIGGTNFDDRLFGDNDASIFYGGAGADRLFGRNGDDELYGEDGNDIILGGRDNDLIDGGAGNDQLRGNEGDDTIFGGDGNDAITGGAGADAMDGGAGIDRVEYTYGTNAGVTASLEDSSINTGDAAGDTYINIENLYGTSFVDMLFGDAGNNRIDGRLGDDALFGGNGNDYLLGGAGNDVLNGEGGNDLLLGQAGADTYQFDGAHGTDRIVVFTQGEDLIDFTENVSDFSALTITQDGTHVNIVSSEGTIIVNNSLVADFAADDFIFASPSSNEPLDDIFAQDRVDDMMTDIDVLI